MLAQALDHLVRGVVDHPDDVAVELIPQGRNRLLEVQVHPDDVGKVIGRNGRTVKALRQVMGSVGGRGIRVEILDDVLDGGVEDMGEPAEDSTAVGST